MKEKRITEKVADAWDEILGHRFVYDLPDSDLSELAALLWAMHLDLQNEWVRRRMVKS